MGTGMSVTNKLTQTSPINVTLIQIGHHKQFNSNPYKLIANTKKLRFGNPKILGECALMHG